MRKRRSIWRKAFELRSVEYGEAARRSLIAIFRHIADEGGGPLTGKRFVVSLRAKCQSIARLPGTIGTARPELGHGFRSLPFRSYVIFFRYERNRVHVVDVVHGQRDILAYFGDAPDTASES